MLYTNVTYSYNGITIFMIGVTHRATYCGRFNTFSMKNVTSNDMNNLRVSLGTN